MGFRAFEIVEEKGFGGTEVKPNHVEIYKWKRLLRRRAQRRCGGVTFYNFDSHWNLMQDDFVWRYIIGTKVAAELLHFINFLADSQIKRKTICICDVYMLDKRYSCIDGGLLLLLVGTESSRCCYLGHKKKSFYKNWISSKNHIKLAILFFQKEILFNL